MAPHNKASKPSQKPKLHYLSNIIPQNSKPLNVAELVYGFLSDLAIKDAEKKVANRKRLGRREFSIKKPARHRRKYVNKPHKGTTALGDDGNALGTNDELNSTKPRPQNKNATSNESVKSRNNVKTTASKVKKKEMKKRSMMQMINKYIKSGFEEGKRQAKAYVKKALSLAVDNGYLIPADKEGKTFRVSGALEGFTLISRRSNAEARKKRRRLRRGEDPKKDTEKKEPGKAKTDVKQKEPQKRAEPESKSTGEEKKTKETKETKTIQKRESKSKSKNEKDRKKDAQKRRTSKSRDKVERRSSKNRDKMERRTSRTSRHSGKSGTKLSVKNASIEFEHRRNDNSNEAINNEAFTILETRLPIKNEPSDRDRFNEDSQNHIPYIN